MPAQKKPLIESLTMQSGFFRDVDSCEVGQSFHHGVTTSREIFRADSSYL